MQTSAVQPKLVMRLGQKSVQRSESSTARMWERVSEHELASSTAKRWEQGSELELVHAMEPATVQRTEQSSVKM